MVYGIEEGKGQEEQQQQLQLQRCRIVGSVFPNTNTTHKRFVVVGYALTSKKTKSFLQPKLEGLARY